MKRYPPLLLAMPSLKASSTGLSLIKSAIAQKGWRVRDDRWLVAASYLLEPDGNWQPDGPYAYGCSLQTWERFLQRVAIRDRSFVAFCHVLNLAPHQVAESMSASSVSSTEHSQLSAQIMYLSEGDMPVVQRLLARMASLEHRMHQVEQRLDSGEPCGHSRDCSSGDTA